MPILKLRHLPALIFTCLSLILTAQSSAAHDRSGAAPPSFAGWHDIDSLKDAKDKARFLYRDDKTGIKGQEDRPPGRQHPDDSLTAPESEDPPSALEKSYAGRIVDEPVQFGYDMFSGALPGGVPDSFALPSGMAQDDFVLGSGDTLDITFRGQRQDRISATVGQDGYLIIDDLPPVAAAGNTIGHVRAVLESHAAALHNTGVYMSLSGVRQVNVLVIGHIKKPGRKVLTVFHSVLDALIESGGIEKTGSLRQIRLIRGGRSTIIDLYGLLIHGSNNMDLSLRDGDRLVVPPVGPTVAVTGSVKRPGIYEILPALKGMRHNPAETSQILSLQDMLDFAGGTLSAGQNRFLKLGLTRDGRETVEEINDSFAPVFSDSTILMVMASDGKRAGTVELSGHTRRPGLHALTATPSLSALLDGEQVFGSDIYPLIGIIERWDAQMMTTRLLSFSPKLVIKGDYDTRLEDGDVIHLFSRAQIAALYDSDTYKTVTEQRTEGSSDSPPAAARGGITEDSIIEDSLLRSFLKDHAAVIHGAVRRQGRYPVTAQATLEDILAAAGGMTLEADRRNIELTAAQNPGETDENNAGTLKRQHIDLTQTAAAAILPGPAGIIRVGRKFRKAADNSVLIIGEVKNPGRYDLTAGEKLSGLIQRAGGITADAYPEGAIFSREKERKAEEASFRAQAQELELKLAGALQQKEEPEMRQIEAVQKLVAQLRNAEALGRITVEADPAILEIRPELDILLEKGDRIYIPKRPLTVKVSGEVLSPANLQFRSSKTADDYINEAGGMTHNADRKRVFVLYPDGSAQPLVTGPWNHNPVLIPPGATVMVPHDPEPFDFIRTAKDITQILTNIAITGIFIDDLKD